MPARSPLRSAPGGAQKQPDENLPSRVYSERSGETRPPAQTPLRGRGRHAPSARRRERARPRGAHASSRARKARPSHVPGRPRRGALRAEVRWAARGCAAWARGLRRGGPGRGGAGDRASRLRPCIAAASPALSPLRAPAPSPQRVGERRSLKSRLPPRPRRGECGGSPRGGAGLGQGRARPPRRKCGALCGRPGAAPRSRPPLGPPRAPEGTRCALSHRPGPGRGPWEAEPGAGRCGGGGGRRWGHCTRTCSGPF